jgi:malonyl CoA-acyl carrier protein transacylase
LQSSGLVGDDIRALEVMAMEIVRKMVPMAESRVPRWLLPPVLVGSRNAHVVVGGKDERMLFCES